MNILKKNTLSIAIITKNEEKNIKGCLRSISGIADEIIILDSGSSDQTVAIAKEFQAKIITNTEWKGFGHQRRLCQTHVTSDYVLWLDADERVTPQLAKNVLEAVRIGKKGVAYSISRRSWCFGGFINNSGWYPDKIVRLYKKEECQYSDDLVHEKVVVPKGIKIEELHGDLTHYTYDSIRHYQIKSAQYAELWAAQRHNKGKSTSLTVAITHALACFIRMYFIKVGFLDGKRGLLLALLSAHSTFIKYADLWTKNQPERPD